MRESMCPSLHRLGLLLQAVYPNRRNPASNSTPQRLPKLNSMCVAYTT